jgi:hypothetical protein
LRQDFDDLPDDPTEAFILLAQEMSVNFDTQMAGGPNYQQANRYRLQHMSNVIAIAKELAIDEISSWKVPESEIEDTTERFRIVLNSYLLAAGLRTSSVAKRNSVGLNAPTKARLHHLVNEIREVLESLDVEDRKRNSLMSKLNAFAADIDRRRTRFDNLMGMILEGVAVTKEVGEAINPFNELIKRVTDLISQAKEEEGTLQLPPPSVPKKLAPPPKQLEGPKSAGDNKEDDIPF